MADTRPRLALFIDRQNVYKSARETFGFLGDSHTRGQVNPLLLGRLVAGRVVDNTDRRLVAVNIYRGLPDARKQPRGNAAAMRQNASWENLDPVINVVARPLRYPRDWPNTPEREKGIDVQLAIDFVSGYMRRAFDVGVLFSSDTDLLPPLEVSYEIVEQDNTTLLSPEVAAWGDRSRGSGYRLRPNGLNLHCHWLGPLDFQQCRDDTDYNFRP